MTLNLSDKVEKVPLIGTLKAGLLRNLNIFTVEDLLHHYPFRYDDFSNTKKIAQLSFGEIVTVTGSITKAENIYTKSRKSMVKATISDETGQIDAIWFNQPYLAKALRAGSFISLSGKTDWFSRRLTFMGPDYELITNDRSPVTAIHTGRLVPIYPETAGVSSKWLRSRIDNLLRIVGDIEDYLPRDLLESQGLIGLSNALKIIHFPKDYREVREAKKRLSFDELFVLQAKSLLKRKRWEKQSSNFQFPATRFQTQIDEFTKSLPFELTDDQIKVTGEILKDLEGKKPMNRLLQGDVGSGKTVVAVVASFAAYLAGYKTLYMAPTEILARQHYETFNGLLGNLGVKIGLSTSSANKDPNYKLLIPDSQIAVGTHALLYNVERLKSVGLVIIDEQHKFGVEQRTKLIDISKSGSSIPHFLAMTATPIPRTLALTALGDLDISLINQMPKDRKEIKTWVTPKEKRMPAYEWIKKQINAHKTQAYIVCPFIEQSEVETLKSVRAAKKEFESLSNIFKPLKVELLHGKMKPAEKDRIMRDFARNKIKVLVSTPVVEVGIDNPNAAIIIVEGSDRFGLASLHQLRGRVGRGNELSYCLLFTENDSPEIVERLKLLEKYKSGLQLAEMDLKIRGSGQIYGKEQSGFIKTKIADLSDSNFIIQVNSALKELLRNNPDSLKSPRFLAKLYRDKNVHMD